MHYKATITICQCKKCKKKLPYENVFVIRNGEFNPFHDDGFSRAFRRPNRHGTGSLKLTNSKLFYSTKLLCSIKLPNYCIKNKQEVTIDVQRPN